MTSSSADWTLAGARLISSASSRLANTGPSSVRNSPWSGCQMRVPTRSAGTRSGVNWTRLKEPPSTSASVRTVSVLARPGTPSSRTWPPASSATSTRSSIASWPTTTRLHSHRAACERAARLVGDAALGVRLGGEEGEIEAMWWESMAATLGSAVSCPHNRAGAGPRRRGRRCSAPSRRQPPAVRLGDGAARSRARGRCRRRALAPQPLERLAEPRDVRRGHDVALARARSARPRRRARARGCAPRRRRARGGPRSRPGCRQALEQRLVAADAAGLELQLDVDARRGGLAGDVAAARRATAARSTGSSRRAPSVLTASSSSRSSSSSVRSVVSTTARATSRSSSTLGVGVVERDLGLGADDRQRGAQLVAGVGDEPALGLDGALDAVEHRVEGDGQLVQLVVRAGRAARARRAGRRRSGAASPRSCGSGPARGRPPASRRRARPAPSPRRERVLHAELPEHAARRTRRGSVRSRWPASSHQLSAEQQRRRRRPAAPT